MHCPDCGGSLTVVSDVTEDSWGCAGCRGVLLTRSALGRHLSAAASAALWRRAEAGRVTGLRPCPRCQGSLNQWSQGPQGASVMLDACTACELLWFDAGELGKLNARRPDRQAEDGSSPWPPTGWDLGSLGIDALGELLVGLIDF